MANQPWDDKANQLIERIKATIRLDGPMPFSNYMHQCLYDKDLGYYQSRHQPIGTQGDFITAPEISPLFSHCLARQWLQLAYSLEHCQILEVGAGSGRMAADILYECKRQGQLPPQYLILETSPLLQSVQFDLLKKEHPDYIDRVTWITSWPTHFTGLILGNEVLDAMPVERIRYDGSWQREYITINEEDSLCFQYHEDKQINQWPTIQVIPRIKGYHTELSLIIPAWIQSAALALHQGLLLLIDYGYPEHELYHPERCHGTLMCHHRHQTNQDPLWLPGCQDITAHVNFTQVANAALDAGLDLMGYCHQAAFLMNTGITNQPQDENIHHAYQTSQALKQLLMPQEMGEKFKAIALGKGLDASLLGFSRTDQRHYLFQTQK